MPTIIVAHRVRSVFLKLFVGSFARMSLKHILYSLLDTFNLGLVRVPPTIQRPQINPDLVWRDIALAKNKCHTKSYSVKSL